MGISKVIEKLIIASAARESVALTDEEVKVFVDHIKSLDAAANRQERYIAERDAAAAQARELAMECDKLRAMNKALSEECGRYASALSTQAETNVRDGSTFTHHIQGAGVGVGLLDESKIDEREIAAAPRHHITAHRLDMVLALIEVNGETNRQLIGAARSLAAQIRKEN